MYIDEKKAAQFLDISPASLRVMRCKGTKTRALKDDQAAMAPIPYSKFGRTIRYKVADLEEYASRFRVEG